VILVEHEMNLVMGISDRVIVLDAGSKISEGNAGTGFRRPARAQGISRRGQGSEPCAQATACLWSRSSHDDGAPLLRLRRGPASFATSLSRSKAASWSPCSARTAREKLR